MKTKTLIAAIAIALFSTGISSAQAEFSGDGIYTDGSTHSYKTLKFEPVYWINAANEFVVYVPYERPIVLTLKDQPNIKLSNFPKFTKVVISDYSFMLATEDKKAYYFTTDGYEQNQTLELMRNFGNTIVKVDKGSKFTQNEVTIPLEKLKAAKSVYDVLGK